MLHALRRRRSPRRGAFVAAGALVAAGVLAACGGGGSGATNTKAANADAAAACSALARSTPVGAGTIALGHRLEGAAQLGLAAVGENGATYANLQAAMQKLYNDATGDNVNQLAGDVTNALALCKGDSLPH